MSKKIAKRSSRRGFLKTGLKVIPALAVIGIAVTALPTAASACGNSDCANTCSGNCQNQCGYNCQNSCSDKCTGGNEINSGFH